MVTPIFQNYVQFVQLLDAAGFQDVVLPFFLIFTVIFAVLQKTHPLGKKKSFNVVFALVVSLLVVIPHVTGTYQGFDVVSAINSAIPKVSYWVVLGIMFLVLLGTFGISLDFGENGTEHGLRSLVIWGSFLIVALIFAQSAGWLHWEWLGNILNLIDPNAISLFIIILVFVAMIAFISGGEDDEADELKKYYKKNKGGRIH